MKKKFVLSSKSFCSLKEAEEKATGYFKGGQLVQNTRCFMVTKEYRPVIKFVEVKK